MNELNNFILVILVESIDKCRVVDDFAWHENEIEAPVDMSIHRINNNFHMFNLLDTNITKYIYVLLHDLIFMPDKIINHTALVNTFDKYYENEIVQLVRFNKDANTKSKYMYSVICVINL